MEVKASTKHLRMSARKVRLVTNLILGMGVLSAQAQLRFSNKRSAQAVLKLLNSALANAENNFKLNKNNLYIKSIYIDEGPVLKRWLPRAHGRATPIKKRTAHLNLILDEKEPTPAAEIAKRKKEITAPTKDVTARPVRPAKEAKEPADLPSEKDLDRPFVEEEKPETKVEQKEITRKGWQDRKQDKGGKRGLGGAFNKIFRRKSF